MNARRKKSNGLLTVLILLLAGIGTWAQTVPPLERTVTLEFVNEKIEGALIKLGKAAKATFSYNAALIDQSRELNMSFKDKTVREVLEAIFEGTLTFKEKGNYIIVSKAPRLPQKASSVPAPMLINGYVLDARTGEKLSGVSIYDKRSFTAAVTNSFGYFSLRLSEPEELNHILFTKRNFMDTVLTVAAGSNEFVNILLAHESSAVVLDSPVVEAESESFSTEQNPVQEPLISDDKSDKESLSDTVYRNFQVSVLPFIGTNKKLSGNVINGYSLNVLGGYSLGTKHIELGGLFNRNRGNTSGVQVAGLYNIGGGKMTGLQAAGLFNSTRKGVEGAQLAGIVNINSDSLRGTQIAGLANINSGKFSGGQVAGLVNLQTGNYKGVQLAGLINVASGPMVGTQISGFMNYGKNVRGVQLGLINVADSLNGVPIGLFSYVKNGYHKFEFSADEIFHTNIAFRTGTHKFYNIIAVGLNPERDQDGDVVWSFGYGLGTAPKLTRWLYLNIDLTANQITNGEFVETINLLNKLYAGFEVQPIKKVALAFGVTLNGYLSKQSDTKYGYLLERPSIINDHNYNNGTNLKMWWGYKVAVRFF